jgi:hypothetical protein
MKVTIYNDQIFDKNYCLVSAKTKVKEPKDLKELKYSLVGEIAERVDIEISLTKDNLDEVLEFIDYSKPAFK